MIAHQLRQLEPNTIGMLVWMLIEKELDALLFLRVGKIVDYVSLDTSEHLSEFSCYALLAILDDPRQV